MFFKIYPPLPATIRTHLILGIFLFALPISAQQVKLEKPLLKDFADQGFPKMTQGDYFTLEKDEFLYRLLDGLPQFYSDQQFQELLQKLRPELKELYFFSFLTWSVSNGGFSYFYDRGYGNLTPEIKEFYKRIGEEKGLEILERAETWYQNRPKEEVWVDFRLDALDQEFNSKKPTLDGKVEAYVRANSHLYVRDENGDVFLPIFSGKAVSFDPLTRGVKEIQIVNNRKEGKMTITSPEGIILREFNFENGVQVGVQRYFGEDGKLDREEILFPDTDIKEIRYYHPNGQLSYQGKEAPNYRKVGQQTYWHDNGTVKYSYLMDANGNHTAPYFEYYPDGSKMLEVDRRENPPKYLNFWDENGVQLLKDGNGIYISESGSLPETVFRYEYQFKNYKEHGIQRMYRNGILTDYREMSEGQLHGYYRKYYPNGKLHQEFRIENGKVLEFQEKPLFDNPKLVVEIETEVLESYLIQKEYELSDQYPRLLNKNEVLPLISVSKDIFGEYGWEQPMFGSYLLHVDQNGKVVGHDFFSSTNDSIDRSTESIFPQLKFEPGQKNGVPVKSYIWFKVRVWLEEQTPN
jgi:antitoxin component YwqK of YwqJK toxin-antitoxin module